MAVSEDSEHSWPLQGINTAMEEHCAARLLTPRQLGRRPQGRSITKKGQGQMDPQGHSSVTHPGYIHTGVFPSS